MILYADVSSCLWGKKGLWLLRLAVFILEVCISVSVPLPPGDIKHVLSQEKQVLLLFSVISFIVFSSFRWNFWNKSQRLVSAQRPLRCHVANEAWSSWSMVNTTCCLDVRVLSLRRRLKRFLQTSSWSIHPNRAFCEKATNEDTLVRDHSIADSRHWETRLSVFVKCWVWRVGVSLFNLYGSKSVPNINKTEPMLNI